MTFAITLLLGLGTMLLTSSIENISLGCTLTWILKQQAAGTPNCVNAPPGTTPGTTPQASNQAPGSVVSTS